MSLLSVLMPMRNAERYVQAAVESVLAQQGVDLELIVVNDHSTDRSPAIVRAIADPRLRIVDAPRAGVAVAYNAGLEAAKGDILARCDADDLYPEGRLSWQTRWLADHPEFGAVCGRVVPMTDKGRLLASGKPDGVAYEITREIRDVNNYTSSCTLVVRTEIVRRLGGCRGFFVMAEDTDLVLRISEACRVWHEPRVCYFYRLHDSSITHSQSKTLRLFYNSTARRFCAQRQATGLDDLQRGCPPEPPSEALEPPSRAAPQIQGILRARGRRQRQAGHKWRAVQTCLRACLMRPSSFRTWRSLLAVILKRTGPKMRTPDHARD